jgi:hypothetical protein
MATRKGGGEIGEMVFAQLRENVHAGIPYRQPDTPGEARGYGDLIFLVTGHHYAIACDFIHEKNDTETLITLWSELREDILREHIKHRPGGRPWAWWKLEDREQRRVLEMDPHMLACKEGKILESETEYLERLGLLRKKERKALREE